MVCILIEIRNLEGSKSVMVQAECERYYSRGPAAMRCERTRALTTLPRPAGVLQTQQGSDVMNYAAIFSYIFRIMPIQSRIIRPHNSKQEINL